ncbi:MAG: PP2C family protein-serine/threonine phosphatase [Desulfobacterales bacterium]|nr:PP2C family protein-serine/threonine phosphatase [Desulfobacterales bacterium]
MKLLFNRFQINSIRAKLSLILIFTVTAIFAGFAFFNYFVTKSDMNTELHSLTDSLAEQLSESLMLPIWTYDKTLEKIVYSEMLEKQVYAIIVKNEDRELICGKIRDKNWNIINAGKEIYGNYYSKTKDIFKKDEKLGTVKIYISPEFMQQKLEKITVILLISLIFLDILLVTVLYVGIGKNVIHPVSRLAESVRIIASGCLDKKIYPENKDEVGQLASDTESMRLAIKDLTDNLEKKVSDRTQQLKEARDELWGEMELAKKIQTVLLPEKPEISGYDIAASMNPADKVGGDYYDVICVGGYDWIVVGDVSGHGVTAGLVMMMVQSSIHTVLLENPDVQPSHLLSAINRTIYQNLGKMSESKHMTIVVLAGGRDGLFTFSGLHEDILVWRAETGEVHEIETDGTWIGLEPDISHMLSDNFLRLEPGDSMILFTDGITEAQDGNSKLFGQKRLIKIIEEFGNKPAYMMHKNIINALEHWEKPDDVTLVVVKRFG